jgi:hypothetical protein
MSKKMYGESELVSIMSEWYFKFQRYVNMHSDHVIERASLDICKKHGMVIVPLSENGSRVAIAQKYNRNAILIDIIEGVGLSASVGKLPKYIWN